MRQKKYRPQAQDLFELKVSKSQEQQIKIIEAAISSFAVKGLEKTTYTYLAKLCGISRPLIHHYFPALEDLFLLTARYVRETLLKLAIDEMQKNDLKDPVAQLNGYSRGCLNWVRDYPHQCSFWFLYYYQSSRSSLARKENTELVTAGHNRITSLLEQGNQLGIWKIADCTYEAKKIQVLVTGVMVSCMTEDGYLSLEKAADIFFDYFQKMKIKTK